MQAMHVAEQVGDLAALVERARGGDHDAFAMLVTPQLDRLYGLAGLLLRDRSRTEDAVQNALMRAWRDLPGLREPEKFDAWLRKLVVNATHDEGRRLRRRRGEVPMAANHEPHTSGGVGALADRDELMRGFDALGPEERSVVALRYYLDLPTSEAANAMGMREVTYRSKLHRSLKKLRAAISVARQDGRPAEGHGS